MQKKVKDGWTFTRRYWLHHHVIIAKKQKTKQKTLDYKIFAFGARI